MSRAYNPASIALLAAASLGFGAVGYGSRSRFDSYDFEPEPMGNGNRHEPRSGITYIDSGKPMSKRAKRRARGKASQ
jgi:hypothetical protein